MVKYFASGIDPFFFCSKDEDGLDIGRPISHPGYQNFVSNAIDNQCSIFNFDSVPILPRWKALLFPVDQVIKQLYYQEVLHDTVRNHHESCEYVHEEFNRGGANNEINVSIKFDSKL